MGTKLNSLAIEILLAVLHIDEVKLNFLFLSCLPETVDKFFVLSYFSFIYRYVVCFLDFSLEVKPYISSMI